MRKLFATDEAWTGMILRVMLGAVMFPHGAQKLLGLSTIYWSSQSARPSSSPAEANGRWTG